nr:uncharacterized protein LOC111502138 isoform X1 [Leptinotarsa decemlineata]XP_023011899.1 uncharacterized protein LOC111502138 isoform X2 [Leptinotarsa decemlineata]
MGLLDEMFAKKKETTRSRTAKSTPVKKDPEKTSQTTDKNRTFTQTSSFFGSLKRVQGATPAPKRNDVTKSKTVSVLKSKPPEKQKDKDKRPWYRSPPRNLLKKEPIKSSSASLNVASNVQKSAVDERKKRPTSLFSSNVTYRRGQNSKLEGHNLGDNLSRTSSITNIDADQKNSKGAKPRKSASRDRIDKIGDKKHDKKGLNKNNNKLDVGENTYPSVDSLAEEELLHLRRQLQEMAQEKTNLALQLGEQKGQLNNLQKEIQKLKSFQDESNIQMEQLSEENSRLRKRLKDVAHSPLSDNEKQQLLFNTHRHHHSSSAPASIATNIVEDGSAPDTTCTTPDWDKQSSSNVSEVSVACLQDKINQMQETHYSTNEELQATLQELTDLQRQLTELQQENERLNDEKNLMFDSLCRQTERLNDSRSEVESLKQLLYQEKDDTGQYESAVEREQKLVDLLKSAQEEREALLVKIEQLTNETQESRAGNISKDEQIGQLRDRVRTLECTLDAKHAEHKLLDQELAQAKDQCSAKQIEINRLTDLLDNARTKISELEQDRALSDKSELDELLDNARKEKDALESEVAHLKEQLAIGKNEIEKLKEQVSILQEECKVTRNNAKTTQSDLEYKCEKLQQDKNVMNDQLQEFQEALNELQVQSQCQLEDKRQLSSVLSETQRNLSEAERKNQNLENDLEELKKHIAAETADWEKFQDDLLTSVRVANDFKTEAQQELQRMILENKAFRDREKQLRAEIEKLKGESIKRGTTRSTLSSKNNQKLDILIKRPSKNIIVEPKKRRDSNKVQTSSPKSNKVPLDAFSRPVKKREIKPSKQKKLKTLSVEEETLLKSLDTYNQRIDKNIPDENLTEEQKVIRKLKVIYEDELLKIKPVAPKAKDQLAISKPLLDSVLGNPKLFEIVRNPNVRTIEDMATFAKDTPEIRTLIQGIDRTARGKSEDVNRLSPRKRISLIGRSMSCDDLYDLDDTDYNSSLYRTFEAEDLTRDILLSIQPRDSSIVPSDSISNLRYSDFAVVVNEDKERKLTPDLNYSSLEKIVKSIPKDIPHSELTKEQKFALRLLQTLNEEKYPLKKLPKAKNLPISIPTYESVLNNPKLEKILHDPDITEVCRRNSDIASPTFTTDVLRNSKSFEDISFRFGTNRAFDNEYNNEVASLDSSDFSSAEFNLDTGLTGPYDPTFFEGCQQDQFHNSLGIEDNMSAEYHSEGCKKVYFHTFLGTNAEQEDSMFSNPNQESKRDGTSKKIKAELETEKRKESKIGENDESLTYYDTLNKVKHRADTEISDVKKNSLKVDLLQEKIRKIVRNDVPRSKSEDTKITKQRSFIDIENRVMKSNQYDSLVYNETLNKKLKTDTKSDTDRLSPTNTLLLNPNEISTGAIDISSKPSVPDLTAMIYTIEKPEYDSLTKKETNKNIKKNEIEIQSALTASKIYDMKNDHDETFQKINEKLEVIHKLISEDKNNGIENNKTSSEFVTRDDGEHEVIYSEKNANLGDEMYLLSEKIETNTPGLYDNGENITNTHFGSETLKECYSDTTDAIYVENEPTSPEYDYHAILRENRFGVKPPLNYRLSYKDVVKQIKNRFSTDDHRVDVSERNDSDSDTSRNVFTLRRTCGMESLDKEQHFENVTKIDKEMEDIFQNYLHTRVSTIIKESEGKSSGKENVSSDYSLHVSAAENFQNKQLRDTNNITLRDENVTPLNFPVPKPRKVYLENTIISDVQVCNPQEHIKDEDDIQSFIMEPKTTNTEVDRFSTPFDKTQQEAFDEINTTQDTKDKQPSYELPLISQLYVNVSSFNEGTEFEEHIISNQQTNKHEVADISGNLLPYSVQVNKINSPLKEELPIDGISAIVPIPSHLHTSTPLSSHQQENHISMVIPDTRLTQYTSLGKDSEQQSEVDSVTNSPEKVDLQKSSDNDQASNTPEFVMKIGNSEEISVWKELYDGEFLTEEEVSLICQAKKKQRPSRPLSDINENDLKFIKRISMDYSLENLPTSQDLTKLEVLNHNDEVFKINDTELETSHQSAVSSFYDTPSMNETQNVHSVTENKNEPKDVYVLADSYELAKKDNYSVSEEQKDLPTLTLDSPVSFPIAFPLDDISCSDHLTSSNRPNKKNSEDLIITSPEKISSESSNYLFTSSDKNIKEVKDVIELPSADPASKDYSEKTNEKHLATSNPLEKPDDLESILLKMMTRSVGPRSRINAKKTQEMVYKEKEGIPMILSENVINDKQQKRLTLTNNSSSYDTEQLRTTPQLKGQTTTSYESNSQVEPVPGENSEKNKTSVQMRKKRPVSGSKVVKSFAQHFERLSLDKGKKVQPVHAINNLKPRNTSVSRSSFSSFSQNIKKALPVPRSEDQASSEPNVRLSDISHNVDSGKDIEVTKMLGNQKNFSDSEHTVPHISVIEPQKEITEVPGLHESHKSPAEILQEVVQEDLGKIMSTSNIEKKDEVDDQEDVASGTSTIYSTIEIAGKSEQLDITKPSEKDVEDTFVENVSDVNLFNMEAPSFDESYLKLFKTPEDLAMEQFSGKKSRKGYLNITYLGEVSDSESFDEVESAEKKFIYGTDSKPKIVDFVPLDEGTKPVFEKEHYSNYNTLEREKTFQIFSSAPGTKKEKDVIRKREPEIDAKLKYHSSIPSFSAAKKMFEDLQTKSDNKTDKQVTGKASTNDRLSNVEIARSSPTGLVTKSSEGSKNDNS